MMPPDRQRPVTLEDILRLKRSERPPAEFWTQFDRELRAKQLAALVEKRPWWRTISLADVFGSVRRFQLPLGAAAVLAVSFFSVREYRSSGAAPVVKANPQVAALVNSSAEKNEGLVQAQSRSANATASNDGSVASASVAQDTASNTLVAAIEPVATPTSSQATPAVLEIASPTVAKADFVLSSAATPEGDLAQAIVGLPGGDDSSFSSPSARLIAENLAVLQADDATFANPLLGSARAFETRGTVARNKPVEPLAQLRVPSSARRSALIASATFVSTTAPVLTSDRAARGLSDERLYETVSRVNARGAGMLVKF